MQSPATPETQPSTQTMLAMVYSEYGVPRDVMSMNEVPVPEISDDQVLVRVNAAGVNALDWRLMTGTPYLARIDGPRRPARNIPGADIAGTVVATGSEVSDLEIGDEVFGEIAGGGFAEYVAVKASNVVPRPTNLTMEETATLGVAALTALQGLRDWGGMKAGQSVLINGASGGVGTFAVQIARALGASKITAVASTRHLEAIEALGVDRVIDYTKEDFTRVAGEHDLLFDNAGMNTGSECRRVVAEHGTHVMITGPMGGFLGPFRRVVWSSLTYMFNSQTFVGGKTARSTKEDLLTLKTLVEEGKIVPVMDRRWTLDQAVEAVEYQGEGHARGKSIVVVS